MTATDFPNMNAEKRSVSPHSDNVYLSKEGRMVRIDVDPVPMNPQGRCRMWDIKGEKYIWLQPVDAKEWIVEGLGSWTEVEGSTIQDSARALLEEGVDVMGVGGVVTGEKKSLDEMSYGEMITYAEALGMKKIDKRWGEVRLRNVIDAELKKDDTVEVVPVQETLTMGTPVEHVRDSGMPPS